VQLDIDQAGMIVSVETGVDEKTLSTGASRFTGWAIPGICNLHSHAHQRAMAGLGEQASGGDSFWTWREAMYRTVERIDPDQLYAVARMAYLEMLESGYTRVGEFQYLHHDRTGNPYANRAEMTLQCARAAADVGIGFTALPVLYRYGGFGEQQPGDAQKRFINDADGFLEIVSQIETALEESANCGVAPHSLRATSPALLREVLTGQPASRPVHIHVAEQTREVEDCLDWCGSRPVQWLLDNQPIDRRWVFVHATHMDESETTGLALSGAVAGLCPTTEANLGDGFFNAIQFLELGGVWGIGSDSHISISPDEELRWLEYGQRLLMRSRNILGNTDSNPNTGAGLLRAATAGGAQACAHGDGVLEPGQPADLVVLDASHPRLLGRAGHAVIDSWIFSSSGNAIKSVVVGGKQVVDAGSHPEREQIVRRFGNVVNRLAS